MASRHLSIRVADDVVERLDAESARSGRSRSDVAKRLIEEGLRRERHPGITFRDGPAGRRAGLVRGPDVWEIVRALQQLGGEDDRAELKLAEQISLNPEEIRIATRYYSEYPEEIDTRIRLDEEEAERAEAAWRRRRALQGA
jgi:predicted transcriptional regulator